MTKKIKKDDVKKIMNLLDEFSKPMPTPIFDSAILESKDKIEESIKASKPVNDSYGNKLLSIGTYDKTEGFTSYGLSNDSLNYPLWLALYDSSWVFRRAIDKPAHDMIKAGVVLENTKKSKEVYKLLQKSRTDMIQLIQWGALFGGSVAVMMFDNIKDEDYVKPINYTKIAKAKTIRYYVTDRWYGVQASNETVEDMEDIDFGKPSAYRITFADGNILDVHHSYVLRYEGRYAPNLIKKGHLQGWGYAEGAHIFTELSRNDKLRNAIQSLIDKSLIEIIKMEGMRGVFMGQDDASREQLEKRLEMVNWARNFNSLTFLDTSDQYDSRTFSGLTGLADLMEKNMWLIASALEMQGILFGDLKSGFANDTEALERYDQTIRGRLETYFRPCYEKLIKVFYIMNGVEDDDIGFEFKSLVAQRHDNERMERIEKYVRLLTQLLNNGVITTKMFAESLQEYTTNNAIDFKMDSKYIKSLDLEMEIESEDFDLKTEKRTDKKKKEK